MLEHINAATRTTILGSSPFSNYNVDKETEKAAGGTSDHDPFAPDASNYVRAETPSDAVGGLLAEEMSRPAHARYSFDGTGEGELPISAGAEVEVLDDRDPAYAILPVMLLRYISTYENLQMVVCARRSHRPGRCCSCSVFVLKHFNFVLLFFIDCTFFDKVIYYTRILTVCYFPWSLSKTCLMKVTIFHANERPFYRRRSI